MLKEKKVELENGEVYIVRELPLTKVAPIMRMFNEGDKFEAGIQLVLASTFNEDGTPINGDEVGFSAWAPLQEVAFEVHGWDEGKD